MARVSLTGLTGARPGDLLYGALTANWRRTAEPSGAGHRAALTRPRMHARAASSMGAGPAFTTAKLRSVGPGPAPKPGAGCGEAIPTAPAGRLPVAGGRAG